MMTHQTQRSNIILCVIGLLTGLWFAGGARAAEITVTLPGSDSVHQVFTVHLDGNKPTAPFVCEDVSFINRTGEPQIPWGVITVLVSPQADLETLATRVVQANYAEVAENWELAPTAPAYTWREDGTKVTYWPEGVNPQTGKTEVYQINAYWPAESARIADAGMIRTYKVVQVAVPLAQYNPVSGEIQLLEDIEVALEYEAAAAAGEGAASEPISDPIGREMVQSLAANFDAMAWMYESPMAAGDDDPVPAAIGEGYAIITTDYIAQNSAGLQEFIAHKELFYYDVQVITEDDFGGGTGDTAADNIRAWLQAHYLTDNIKYVLLIGDPRPLTGSVPMKLAWTMYNASHPEYPESAPTDHYYAELTGDWDKDNDGRMGEGDDDIGTNYANAMNEVIVGRIPYYGSLIDLNSILRKTVAYERQSGSAIAWRKNCLLPMEPLNDADPSWPLGEAIKNSFLTPHGWGYYRLYETPAAYPPPGYEATPCNYTNVTNAWKSSPYYGVVVWQTHGWDQGASDVFSTSYVSQLNNNYPSFTFQASCSTAYPETTNNLAYAILKNGGIGTIGATRVSFGGDWTLGYDNQTYIGSMTYDYAERLIGQGMTGGGALAGLRRNLNNKIVMMSDWHNLITFNLYGDPSVAIEPKVIIPTIMPDSGEYYPSVDVTAFFPGSGWTMHYTTDGSDPDQSDTVYTIPLTLTQDTVFKVRAYESSSSYSAVATAEYTITPDAEIEPTITPPGGAYHLSVDVSVSFPKASWIIHYTTDGSDPEAGDSVLTVPLAVTQSCVFKARAFEDGGPGASAVASETYIIVPDELHVDDNGPGDPVPGNPNGSDPLEDGTLDHPFDAVQEAIDVAVSGVTITVAPGTYTGVGNRNINFLGKAIVLRSIEPENPQVVAATVIDCEKAGRGFILQTGESAAAQLLGLTIRNAKITSAGAGIYCVGSSPVIEHCRILDCEASTHGGGVFMDGGAAVIRHTRISGCKGSYGGGMYMKNYCVAQVEHCLIADNIGTTSGGGVFLSLAEPTFEHVTVANNTAGSNGGGAYLLTGTASLTNSIIWGNTSPNGPVMYLTSSSSAQFDYCNVQNETAGFFLNGSSNSVIWPVGCYSQDPLFVDAGAGDYHLQSEAGHWDEATLSWVNDAQTSGAIDTAHPAGGIGEEYADAANVRMNLGAYGGTAQASRTPEGWSLGSDVNNDGVVDLAEFTLLASQWQQTGAGQISDYDGDGTVGIADLGSLCGDWLGETGWAVP